MIKFRQPAVFLILMWCASFAAHAQYRSSGRFKGGILVESAFSTALYHHGITPSLSFGNDCHALQIGPRFGFNRMVGKANTFHFVLDGGSIIFTVDGSACLAPSEQNMP